MKIMIRIIIIIIIMSRFEREDHTTQVSKLSFKFLAHSVAFQAGGRHLRPFASLSPALTGNLEAFGWRHVNESVARMKEPVDFESVRELVAALQLHFQVDYELHRRWSVRRYLEVMQRRGVERQELLKDILERAGPHGLAYGCHLEDLDERITVLLQGQQSLVQLLYWLLLRFRSAPRSYRSSKRTPALCAPS